MLHELHFVLNRGVHVVSACRIFFILWVLYILLLYFFKGENQLITGKRKLKEQWLGLGLGLFSVLYFFCCIFSVNFFF